MKVWPTPTGLGLKLRCGTGVMVIAGVAPDGRGPAIGTSGAAETSGKVNIPAREAVNRTTKAIAAVLALFTVERCIFYFVSFVFFWTTYLPCSVFKLCSNQSLKAPAKPKTFHEVACALR